MTTRPSRRAVLGSAGAAAFTTSLFTGRLRGASDRIAPGFIGTGGRGGDGLIVDFLQHADCQCAAVCDAFTDRRQKRAAQIDAAYAKQARGGYRGAAMHADFRELLQRSDIDAVVIATSDHWHAPILIAAARAGKDVYVEKPLSPCIAWNFAARDAIGRSGRVFQYGTQQRGAGHVRRGCELVRSGAVGDLRSLEVVSPTGKPGGNATPQPVPAGFDYALKLNTKAPDLFRARASSTPSWTGTSAALTRAALASPLRRVPTRLPSSATSPTSPRAPAIRWDPVTETISGDAEAARMMTRDLRKPWSLQGLSR
jgi:hypothetical protein